MPYMTALSALEGGMSNDMVRRQDTLCTGEV